MYICRPGSVGAKAVASIVVLLTSLLCGCATSEIAKVRATASVDCTIPGYEFTPSSSAAAALGKAFRVARTGASDRAPEIDRNSISAVVRQGRKQSNSMIEASGVLSTLQINARLADAGGAAPATVQEELARRMPWLPSYPPSLADANSLATVEASLDVVDLVRGKHATLTRTVAQSSTTAANGAQATATDIARFSRDDHDALQHAWQRMAGLQPFHVLTLLVARKIMDDLDSIPTNPMNDAGAFEALVGWVRIFNTSDFLATYFDAYFRNGALVSVTVSRTAFVDGAIDALKSVTGGSVPDEAALRATLTSACKSNPNACLSFGAVGSTGFVSLFGDKTQFGAIDVSFNGNTNRPIWKPSVSRPVVSQFGPDMVRVLVEAIADANGPHPPAAPTATACRTVNKARLFIDDDLSDTRASGTEAAAKDQPRQCLAQAPAENTEWQRTNVVGNAAEAVVTAGAGALIRSGGIVALNNETIASIVETFAGVTARKAIQTTIARCRRAPAAAGEQIQSVQIGVVEHGAE
ncbi:hypothetical protein [Burkholderia stagnalis]|uniref:hypothetical protein n=1 Tax=Burkholderia stagnalis TaxID=1503054 RepID=UPI000AFC4193|nr:hypothetical protein [Burkholderia stagnalis]